MARSDASLAVEFALELLQHCLLGMRLADGDPPGMGTCAQFADAIKVGRASTTLSRGAHRSSGLTKVV